ncbi:MAG TPA: VOC family protein [Candidatus Limnocylindria bacterium]|nr:VOC family protein [Candidatus Limnocylindria bacterium]
MLTDAPYHPSLAVTDLAKSRTWYADKVGWEPTVEPPGTLVYEVAPTSAFTLYESEFAGTAKNTVMNWVVEDVQAEVARLRENGVEFENYDFGEYKTVDGIMGNDEYGYNAWCKDPDGNIVGVISPAPNSGDHGPAIAGMIATVDLDRAVAWFRDKLGFEPAFVYEGVVANYKSGDTAFSVYKTEFAGTAKNTVGVWRLSGIRDEVARLRGNGVEFLQYDFGDEGKTVGGIISDAQGDVNAWFADGDGNIFAIAEDR